jgi:hypothetical protein
VSELLRANRAWIENHGEIVAVIMAIGFICSILVTRFLLSRIERRRQVLINLAIAAHSLLFSLMVAEWVYRYAIDRTDWIASGETRRWFLRHGFSNSLGYRDVEHAMTKRPGSTRIAFLGDGFIHGYGIEDINDLFPKRIEVMLDREGHDVEVLLFGRAGAGPLEMKAILERYGRDMGFDFVILTHYMNDIEQVDIPGRPMPGDVLGHPPPRFGRLFFHLAVVNYWYYRLSGTHRLVQQQWHHWLNECYQNEEGWRQHTAYLDDVIDYLREAEIPFFYIVIPFLEAIEAGEPYSTWHRLTREYFTSRGVSFIDLRDNIKGEAPRALTVNEFDVHAAPALHARIAQWVMDAEPWRGVLSNSPGVLDD